MEVKFRDFYGQLVHLSDETASGNVRMKVNTCADLNDVRRKSVTEYDLETDISLNRKQVNFMIETLQLMVGDDE